MGLAVSRKRVKEAKGVLERGFIPSYLLVPPTNGLRMSLST